MSADNNKPWEKPWTTEEIIDSASNWSLAGDVGLLKHLEQFSEDFLKKANVTNDNLNNLLQNLTNASLSLDIARNEFLSLSNTQFIESRVYEDDETLPTAEPDKGSRVDEKKQTEDDRIEDLKLAVMTGLDVLNKYFDKVEVPASDSEDETDFPSFVLRPKDPYMDRPLPYIIGSDEWYKKWHVGLEESSSESETEKVSEKFSDTDSESDLPVSNCQIKTASQSGSEADLRINHDEGPAANSTFNDVNKNFFDSNEEVKFAEQLSAKLGDVLAAEVPEPEINRRPIQKTSAIADFGNLFASEPPPLDDLFGSEQSKQKGGLFDDLDDDVSFWGEAKPQAKEDTVPQHDDEHVKGLFDDENPSDDDLFNTDDDNLQKKAPVGGISVLVGEEIKKALRKPKDEAVTSIRDDPGLFDEDADLFDDLFSDAAPKKFSSGLFDDFVVAKPPVVEDNAEEKLKPQSLFDDDDEEFLKVPDEGPPLDDAVVISNKVLSLFDDEEEQQDDDLFLNGPRKIDEANDLFGGEQDSATNLFKSVIETPEDKFVSPTKEDEAVPNINLFESIPPPDLDNWDTRSETNLFDDEIYSFDNVPSVRVSSIYDAEPPSLLCNESSGIVMDHNSARNETEDLSFFPYASSSRRLSTDFTHEDNNDSIFVTKTVNTNQLTDIPEPIQEIDESYSSAFDVTPSGKVEDLYSEATTCADEPSHVIQDKPPLPIIDDSCTGPRKLKHNLNINVRALLPGAPILRKNLEKSKSLDLSQECDNKATVEANGLCSSEGASVEVLQSITKDRVRIQTRRRPSTKRGREAIRKSCIDFFEEPTNTMDESSAAAAASDEKKNFLAVDKIFSGDRRTSFVKTENFESLDFKKSDLFDDEDNGDDMFSTKKLPPKSDILQKSLFGDDDDEDIFRSSSITATTTTSAKSSDASRRPKPSILKKLENTEVIFDPLDALKKES